MFQIHKFSEPMHEVSFHERRNLTARESNPCGANILRALLLSGSVDAAKLQDALHLLTLRHEALRTRFSKNGVGEYVRDVLPTSDLILKCEDFSGLHPYDDEIKAYLTGVVTKGFGPEAYPLASVHLLKTAQQTLLIFLVAEVIADASSVAILMGDLSALYLDLVEGKPANLPPLDYQLSDYVGSCNVWMKSQNYRDSLNRLCDNLHTLIETHGEIGQLIYERTSNNPYWFEKEFSEEFCKKVFRLAAVFQVSPPTVLMIASAMCIARMRNLSGVFFTSSFSNRHISAMANIVGHLATTVPNFLSLRVDENAALPIKKIHRDIFASMARYGMIPIQDISGELVKLYPNRPPRTVIKLGKIVTDIIMVNRVPMLGMKTEAYPSESFRAESNEFKFVYRIRSSGAISLELRGLQGTNNDAVALRVIEHALEDTLLSLET